MIPPLQTQEEKIYNWYIYLTQLSLYLNSTHNNQRPTRGCIPLNYLIIITNIYMYVSKIKEEKFCYTPTICLFAVKYLVCASQKTKKTKFHDIFSNITTKSTRLQVTRIPFSFSCMFYLFLTLHNHGRTESSVLYPEKCVIYVKMILPCMAT